MNVLNACHAARVKRAILTGCFFALLGHSSGPAKTLIVPSSEYPSIGHAMITAKPEDTVMVEDGIYREAVTVSPGVVLIARNRLKTRIVGKGKKRTVQLGTESAVVGMDIQGGTIGVYSEVANASLQYCRIRNCSQSGVVCIGDLPLIEDNVIVFNESSGIQCWDARSTTAGINHNTISHNRNHGISIGGVSDVLVENNIISYNKRAGVKVAETARARFKKNSLWENAEIVKVLPEGTDLMDPVFVAPRKYDFRLSDKSRCRNQGTDNDDLGARISDADR